jgi:hypothetical protein
MGLTKHECDATRESPGIAFAQAELDCIQGCVDGHWIDTVGCPYRKPNTADGCLRISNN